MRIILVLLIATLGLGLGGCALLRLAGAGVGRAAIARSGVAAPATAAVGSEVAVARGMVPVRVSGGLAGYAQQQGLLSTSLNRMTGGGRHAARIDLERSTGRLTGDGRELGRLDASTGDIVAGNGTRLGYLRDGRLYEVLDDGGSRAVASLRGFVPSRGVQLISQGDGTAVSILRSNVVFEVLGVRGDYYLVRLMNGQIGLLPASAVGTLMILAGDQEVTDCRQGRAGQAIRRSGEAIEFLRCKQGDGVLELTTENGRVLVDRYDVQKIVSGAPSDLAEERIAETPVAPEERAERASGFAYAVMQAERPSEWIEREARLWPEEAVRMAPDLHPVVVERAPRFADARSDGMRRGIASEARQARRMERRMERLGDRRDERRERRDLTRERRDVDGREARRDRRRAREGLDREDLERRRQERLDRFADGSRERSQDRRGPDPSRDLSSDRRERRQAYDDRRRELRDFNNQRPYERMQRRDFQPRPERAYRDRPRREPRGGNERRRSSRQDRR